MHITAVPSLSVVPAAQWDALVGDDNPFVEHAFLHGLEITGCVGPGTGWSPCHLLATTLDLSAGAWPVSCALLGAVPAYIKTDSYGEFIFDWSWAHFYQQNGRPYYPKVVAAVPFTPVMGPRLLLGAEAPDAVAESLGTALRDLARQVGAHSAHWLFVDEERAQSLAQRGWLHRVTTQALWINPGYADFEAFLATRTARIRKQIRRERRGAAEAGLELRLLQGTEMDDAQWQAIWRFYQANTDRHGSEAYLNRAFFESLRAHMPHRVVCTLARDGGGRYVAGTLNFHKGPHLYGRYWGCEVEVPFLHFELGFYRLMQHCIEAGLTRFEAGAGGDHKLQRGMALTAIHSAHWLGDPRLGAAIAAHVARERDAVIAQVGDTGDPTRHQG